MRSPSNVMFNLICCLLFCLFLIQCGAEGETTPDFKSLSDDFIPFRSYTINPDKGTITISNDNGTIAYAVAFPYGPHAYPYTGHAFGKASADWVGYVALSKDELTYLDNDYYGMHKDEVEARIPYYCSPVDNLEIVSVRKQDLGSGHIYYGDEMYVIDARIYDGVVQFGHLRKLHEEFIQKIIQSGNSDPRTWPGDGQQNMIAHRFTLAKRDLMAQPQIQGKEVPDNPDYITINIDRPLPWMQIEYTWFEQKNTTYGLSQYYLAPASQLDQFRQAVINGADNRNINGSDTNYIYDDIRSIEWYWRAELGLGKAEVNFDDHSGIISRLGDWWECKDNCPQRLDVNPDYTPGDPLTDDIFVVFPINKDADIYKPHLYSSDSVTYIAQKHKYRDGVWNWYYGEVLEPAELDPIQGQMKIKWRLLDIWNSIEEYQGMSYFLDPQAKKLKIHWQASHVTSESEIILPPIPQPSDPADGEVIIQYNGFGRWFASVYGIN